MKCNNFAKLALTCIAIFSISNAGSADVNFIADTSFESPGALAWAYAGSAGTSSNRPHTGLLSGVVNSSSLSSISQAIVTSPGQQYLVDFWLAPNVAGSLGTINVSFAGTNGFSRTQLAPVPGSYENFNFLATATGLFSTFQFLGQNIQGSYFLDDVSITAVAAAVPEPATWALLLAGLGLLGFAAQRRRKTQ